MSAADDSQRACEDAAADWLVRCDAGLTPEEQGQFEQWLAADPRRPAALAEMQVALSTLGRPRELGREPDVIGGLDAWQHGRERRRRRVFAFTTIGLAAAAALVFALRPFRKITDPVAASVANAVVLRPEHQTLPDGSVIELNAGAEIQFAFSPTRRSVRLARGEAHFAVAKDPRRPFVVSVGEIEVRAVGTEFLVRLEPQGVDVLVTEGRVAIVSTVSPTVATEGPATATPEPLLVPAGTRVAVPVHGAAAIAPRIEDVGSEAIHSALAWRGPRFEFTGTPLAQAVALFNRHSAVQVVLGDLALANLRVSGIYLADNPEGFARLIESTLGLRAERHGDQEIVLRRAP